MNAELEKKSQLYTLFYPLVLFVTWQAKQKKSRSSDRVEEYARICDGGSENLKKIREKAGSWMAMDEVYNYQDKGNRLGHFWLKHLSNSRALRNRYRMVVEVSKREILDLLKSQAEVRLLSLASGSGQQLWNCLAQLKKEQPALMKKIRVLCIDQDQSALEESKRLATNYQLENITWKIGDATTDDSEVLAFKPNLIEVIGLIDYFSETESINFLSHLHQLLPENGRLITAHIHPNPEQYFLEVVSDWPMSYKELHLFEKIIQKSGFSKYELVTEPLKIHTVASAHKQ
jgi:chemotaxis methyl-accepting protein methylase